MQSSLGLITDVVDFVQFTFVLLCIVIYIILIAVLFVYATSEAMMGRQREIIFKQTGFHVLSDCA